MCNQVQYITILKNYVIHVSNSPQFLIYSCLPIFQLSTQFSLPHNTPQASRWADSATLTPSRACRHPRTEIGTFDSCPSETVLRGRLEKCSYLQSHLTKRQLNKFQTVKHTWRELEMLIGKDKWHQGVDTAHIRDTELFLALFPLARKISEPTTRQVVGFMNDTAQWPRGHLLPEMVTTNSFI